MLSLCLLLCFLSLPSLGVLAANDDLELDIPTNIANRSLAVKGQFFCGNKPFAGATVRLFRVFQPNKQDDLAQLMDAKQSMANGEWLIEGNTLKFPITQTEVDPFLTVHHSCGINEKEQANKGQKRWSMRIPADYVTRGRVPRKTYDLGKINLLLQFPGEEHNQMKHV